MPKKHKKVKRKKGHLFGKQSGDVVKHPGAVKEAAARHGKSTAAEAKEESKSPDKKIAARGRLAMRFEGKAKHGNIKKAKGKKKHHHKRVSGKA
jgi:hypothetical protein